MSSNCADRLHLLAVVAQATIAVDQTKAESDQARAKKSPEVAQLRQALVRSRKAARLAVTALDDHAKSHGCAPIEHPRTA